MKTLLHVDKEKLNLNISLTIIIEIFYFLYLLKMILGPTSNISLIQSITMNLLGIFSGLFILIKRKYKNKVLLIMILFYLGGVLSSVFSNNYRLQDYILPLQYLGIGLVLLAYDLDYRVIRISFFLYAMFFAYKIAMGIHPNFVFIGFSRNNISTHLIIQCVLLYISLYNAKKKIDIYPAVITVIIAFWAIGRSGIITSLILLISVIIYNSIVSKKINSKDSIKFVKKIYMFLIGCSVILSFYFFQSKSMFGGAVYWITRHGIKDPHRSRIIKEYSRVVMSSLREFLFGVPIFDNTIFSIYNYNVHNSYLRLHAYYGLIGVAIIVFLLLKSIITYAKLKNILFVFLIIILLVRMTTDILAFNGPFDPFIYFFIFYNIHNRCENDLDIKQG